MELEYDSRPVPAMHRGREWNMGALNGNGSPVAASSSSSSGSGSSTNFASRRRSTAGHPPPPPPGPPPTLPIPSLPPAMGLSRYEPYDGMPDTSPSGPDVPSMNATPYSRPSPSPGLTAVTAFSQARYASVSTSGQPSPTLGGSPSADNLADSPPPSILRAPTAQLSAPGQELSADRLLLPSMEQRSSSHTRPSSRRALTKALELAREAVRLDSTNDDPYGAVMAYARSVALLSEVMERVMRGEDSTENSRRRNGRRRSVVAQEEEVRRLKSIHDTYADRMNILSVVYEIPLPPHSPPSVSSVSVSSDSTAPSTPSSTSPISETSEPISHRSHSRSREREGRYSSETARGDNTTDDESSALSRNSSYTSLSWISSGRSIQSAHGTSSPVHPYAAAASPASVSPVGSGPGSRTSVIRSRPRASSTLPPPPPPPTTLPPPTPSPTTADYPELTPTQTLRPVDIDGRSRGNSVSHRRTGSGSGHLTVLREESLDGGVPHEPSHPVEDAPRSRSRLNVHTHGTSPPLPPIPSPGVDGITPRSLGGAEPASPPPPQGSPGNFMTPRPRGGSTLSVRSEVTPTSKPTLISSSTAGGTISQRRSKTSAPPSVSGDAPSPTESTMSAASVPNMSSRIASALPASTVSSLGIGGRNRALSQPGRRPSVLNANSYPPPSQSASPAPRKPSIPSRLNPSTNVPPQITVDTTILSPPLTVSALSLTSPPLVPPPPIPYANIPAAPLSPLPASAPSDPLRKPYHMMFLLRQTMTSKTGGYVTRRLHVPQEVWSQGGAKLTNVPEKIRVVEVLCSALDELSHWSAEYFGAGSVSSGMALGIGAIGRKEGEHWAAKLEEFSSVCDGVVGQFGKKLGVGEGFATKKSSGVTSWGGRLTRQFDKITNGKNLDSPALYVQGLSRLFQAAQILDEHTKAASPPAVAPLYAAFPPDVRTALETKLRHASEFFAKVVLTFVIRDMALLLDKYVKKCEKWLAE